MKEIICKSIGDLSYAARQLLDFAEDRTIFAFSGDMGAGKTTFIKAICQQLGTEDPVTSPTYSLVNEYHTADGIIYHFDFYRLKNEQEAFDMGYEDYLYSGNLCFIEWPEKISNLLPEGAVKVNLSVKQQNRIITLQK
jgi:tRNA threonylcarbamoyladenosine biosynthesis protein TsaE